jgi:glycosyltransferase involved in cell wall biosynthesis
MHREDLSGGPVQREPATLRIGLADSVDPRELQTGSGASASLLAALREVVREVVPLSGLLPHRLGRAAHLASASSRLQPGDLRDLRGAARRVHGAAKLGRPTIAARTLMMRRDLAAANALDAVVQRASDMELPSSARIVSFEDSTVLQAWRSYPWPHLRGFTEHDVDRYAERQRRIYRSAVACCCATHWVAESIVADYGIEPSKVVTVGMGPNHEVPAPERRDWSVPRFLFVGVDWERKNGAAVLSAFSRLHERFRDATLDVVGGHPPIEQPGVRAHGRLSLVDEHDRDRLAGLYAQATAFVMPSLHEPAGLVYVEAGGAGIASIGTTDGGAATMIGPGGLVVDPRNDEQILAAMLELAEPGRARELGERASAHAQLLSWRKVAERVVRASAVPGLDTSGLAEFL